MLDPRRVLAVEQLEERLRKMHRHIRFEPRHFSPADNSLVRLNLDVRLRPHPKAAKRADFDVRPLVGNVCCRVVLSADRFRKKRRAGSRGSGRGEEMTAGERSGHGVWSIVTGKKMAPGITGGLEGQSISMFPTAPARS